MPNTQIYSAKKTLTDAQIKALPTTPILIVPAQGAGKVIMPIAMYGSLNSTEGAYAENLHCGVQHTSAFGEITNHLTYFSGVAGIRTSYATPFDGTTLPDTAINEALYLESQDGTDYTDGNAANTLKVTVLYIVIDV